MIKIHTISEAERALEAFITSSSPGKKYSLDRMRSLMNFLDNPQDKIKIIHVAGTSGKTSTAYYCAALLKEAGHTVGLTVSPHIDKVSERAQINLCPLDDKSYCLELSTFLTLIEKSELSPSYFEVLIAFAFWIFYRHGVEYGVVEVGVGGLLDSTNVISSPDKVCIITDIGFDHMALLGTTLAEIAAQKAGIVHPHNTVFMYEQSREIVEVVDETCRKMGAALTLLNPKTSLKESPHLSQFQQRNFNLALTAVQQTLNKSFSAAQINKASNTYIPARAEHIAYHGKTLILDGSHNPQKLTALVDSLPLNDKEASSALLVSFGENKEVSIEENLQILHKLSNSIIITAFSLGEGNPRKAILPSSIENIAKKIGYTEIIVEPNPAKAFELLMKRDEKRTIVTGSFYLLNHIRPIVMATAKN